MPDAIGPASRALFSATVMFSETAYIYWEFSTLSGREIRTDTQMYSFRLLRIVLKAILIGAMSCTATTAPVNIVLVLADDQGWTGTSVQMDERYPASRSDLYRTPHLERLASEGMTFSDAYSPAPNCSPTRMSIQTGKTAARLGATDIIDVNPKYHAEAPFAQAFYNRYYLNKPLVVQLPVSDLADAELTIAELLKQHDPNYVTGHFGKWHMGGGSPGRHGYDQHDGLTTNAEGFIDEPDPKLTGKVTDEAVAFLQGQAASGRPFYLQVSYYAVHTPVYAKTKTKKRYNTYSGVRHIHRNYGAMTEELDQGLGRILTAIDTLGLTDSTYVIYTSDNGGEAVNSVTNNHPLARGKTTVFEGGIRVPFIVRGPGIDPGSRSEVPVIGYDLLPTIAKWIDYAGTLPTDLDGGSLAAVLAGTSDTVTRATPGLIWYYGAYRNNKHVEPQAAIRDGRYKLIWEFSREAPALYDLELDVGETTDMTDYQPNVAQAMTVQLMQHFAEVALELPVRNPDYDPTRDLGLTPP